MTDKEKIEFHAIYTKNHKLVIIDQHGREIDGVPDTLAAIRDHAHSVIVKIDMIAPEYYHGQPHVEITVRVPMEVEECLPDWMQECVREKYG